MSKLLSLPDHTHTSVLVSFVDLSRFVMASQRLSPEALAAMLDEFYERIANTITGDGGVVVKYIGDAALIVFDDDLIDDGVSALLELKKEIDAWLKGQGLACELVVQVHFGPVVAGPFGAAGNKRFDVVGPTVNATATMTSRDFALTDQAFKKLSEELKKSFTRHPPSGTHVLRQPTTPAPRPRGGIDQD